MFGKKKTFGEKLFEIGKKRSKKNKKLSRKFLRMSRRSQKRIFKLLTKGPAYFEIFVNIAFGAVVLFLFWKKTKNPDFLSNFGETKIS